MPRPFDRLAGHGFRFRMNAFRLRRLPVNGLKTKQCEQGITMTLVRLRQIPKLEKPNTGLLAATISLSRAFLITTVYLRTDCLSDGVSRQEQQAVQKGDTET